MTGEEIQALVGAQRAFFNSGATLSVDFRIKSLRKLYDAVKAHEGDIQRRSRPIWARAPTRVSCAKAAWRSLKFPT